MKRRGRILPAAWERHRSPVSPWEWGWGCQKNALTIWLPVQMLEIKHFKQTQLKFLISVKNNKYDHSSFEKKNALWFKDSPLLLSFFWLVGGISQKSRSCTFALKIPLTGNCCVTLPMPQAIAADYSLSAFEKGFLEVQWTATHHWHTDSCLLLYLHVNCYIL